MAARRCITRREFLGAAGVAGAAAAAVAGCAGVPESPATSRKAGLAPAPTAAPGPPAAGPAGRKPNIIFILADDLGYGDLGCYGQKRIKTPCLDALAAEGMRFTQVYAGSTVCAPSRCCLMVGQHTGHCFVRGNAYNNLRPEDVTVAEVLRQSGYVTALIGKWGLGQLGSTGHPLRQGFDTYFGYLDQGHAHNYWPTFLVRGDQKVRLPNVVPNELPSGAGVASERVQYSHDLFAQEALDFLAARKDRPFFLHLTYTIPHANNEAKDKGMEVPDLGIYKDTDWPDAEKGKAAMITRMDADVGRLIARLRELGIDRDTLVLFSSDNGPHREGGADPKFHNSSGPLRGIKRDLYEGGIRVPTLARWPGRIKPGSVSDHVWAFWDFLPTAAEVAGAKAPEGLDGISFLPALLGQPARQHEFLYWEFHERGFFQAVRMGDWKAVRRNLGATELYDLARDIGETTDVARDHADVVKRIEAYLAAARTASPQWPIRLPAATSAPATRRRPASARASSRPSEAKAVSGDERR